MKKRSVATVGAALVAVGTLSAGEAQATTITGGGYYATDEIPNQFTNISRSGSTALPGGSDDDASGLINIGFNFDFFGTTYSQFSVSSNGLITFGGGNSSPNNVNLGTTAPTPNLPTIAPLWDDWYAGSPVLYRTEGTAGSRRLIISWGGIEGNNGNTDPKSFQTVLYEGSGDILFSYQDVNTLSYPTQDSGARGAESTIGIRNDNGANLLWSYNSPSVSDNTSIRFSKVPFEFSPGMSLLALGALFGANRLKSKLQKRKSLKSEFSSN